jgi:hypothetical protein
VNYQKLLRNNCILRLKGKLSTEDGIEAYLNNELSISDEDLLVNTDIASPDNLKLSDPGSESDYEFQNSKLIYEVYKQMTPVQATDVRIWTYLTHVTFWDYMKRRRPIEEQPADKRASYISEHWFVDRVSTAKLLRNDISLLWWTAYLTYDQDRTDPYELTKEAFTMLDYTRHLLPGTRGRNSNFVHAIFEFVIGNKNLFSHYKEGKVRFLMRQLNYIAGYKIIASLSKQGIKDYLSKYKKQLEDFKPE